MWEEKYVVSKSVLVCDYEENDYIILYLDKNKKELYSVNRENEIQHKYKSEEEYLQTLK